MNEVIKRTTCRVCGSSQLTQLFSLGDQYISDFVEKDKIKSGIKCPISLQLCSNCTLVQQEYTAPSDFMYTRHYWYISSTTATMRRALAEIVDSAMDQVQLSPGDVVLDIGCFPEAEVMFEDYSPIDIKDINIGDKVIGRYGNPVLVKNKFEKDFTGDLVCFKLRGIQGKTIRMTPNHPILIVRGIKSTLSSNDFEQVIKSKEQKWIRADEVEINDYCVMPEKPDCMHDDIHSLDISSIVECTYDDNYVYATQTDRLGIEVKARNQIPLKRNVELGRDFGRLLGYYVSEGSSDGVVTGGFNFSFNDNETNYITDVQELLFIHLGLSSSTSKGSGACTRVRCSSTLGKKLFLELVGNGACNKKLPRWILEQSTEFKEGILDGMFRGDGSYTSGYAKYDTVSKSLAMQVKQLLHEMNIYSSLVPNKPNGYGKDNGKTLWSVRVNSRDSLRRLSGFAEKISSHVDKNVGNNNKWPTNNSCVLVKILEISKESFSGKVYNIETETNSYVVDGVVVHNSNDGYLLRQYPEELGLITVGVEPATNFKEDGSKGIAHLISDFWKVDVELDNAVLIRDKTTTYAFHKIKKAKIVTAIGMFYDLEEPNQFIADIKKVLHPQGVFIAQLMCLKQTIEMGDIGNLAHEHLEFYSLRSLVYLLSANGLTIYDIEENKVNGGSYRLYICHTNIALRNTVGYNRVEKALQYESDMGLWNPQLYNDWFLRRRVNATNLTSFLQRINGEGKTVWVYGASTKGNVILQFLGIDNSLIEAACDKSIEKVGKYTIGSGIEIKTEQDMRVVKPDYLLILPYSFLEEFISREEGIRESGTKFIVPLPEFKVV